MTLDTLREQIDLLDNEMLRLLNQRAQYALQLGKIKQGQKAEIYVPERERQILERLMGLNAGPLSHQSVQELFLLIFKTMRDLQQQQLLRTQEET